MQEEKIRNQTDERGLRGFLLYLVHSTTLKSQIGVLPPTTSFRNVMLKKKKK